MAKVEAEVGLAAEVAELKERVARLEEAVGSAVRAGAEDDEAWRAHLPAYLRATDEDRARMRAAILESLRAMGLPEPPPDLTREELNRQIRELHERMLQEGVRPEDRVGNTILAEMRGLYE